MKLELRKRKNPSLRKMVKANSEGQVLQTDPVYVYLEEAEGNVSVDGSPVTPEVLEQINWRDETILSFKVLTEDVLPTPVDGIIQIVAKPNQEIWAVTPSKNYPLGTINLNQFLKKTGVQYASDNSLNYFNLNKELKLFSTRTRIGAIPARVEEISNFQEDGTYLEMKNSGYIYFYINGKKKIEFNTEKFNMEHQNASIAINKEGKIDLCSLNSLVQLKGSNLLLYANQEVSINGDKEISLSSNGKINISSPTIKIQENTEGTKFNCFTELPEASYGNQSFRLQFYPTRVRIQDIENNLSILEVEKGGTVYINGNSGIIFENTIQGHIKNYLDSHFEAYYMGCLMKYIDSNLLFSGADKSLGFTLTDEKRYEIFFSDSYDSQQIYHMAFTGTALAKNPIVKTINGFDYRLEQDIATDEQYGDSISIIKQNSSGASLGLVYIRKIYRFN